MLCDTFTLSQNEFDQLFGFNDTESLFSQLDHDANGVIDAIEVFTILAIFSDSRLEDRFRFLFEIFDFNERSWLEEIDLHFMIYTVINCIVKIFNLPTDGIEFEDSVGKRAYDQLLQYIATQFPVDFRINCANLIQWQGETLEIKEFFNFVQILNSKIDRQAD